MMKKYLILLLALVLIGSFTFSQENRKEGNRVEALKIAYITKKLDLSTEEAQRFWPLYNNYMKELRQSQQNQKSNPVPVLEWEEELLSLRKRYETAFAQALNEEKAHAFFQAEKTFIIYLRRELNKRKEGA